MMHTTPSYSIDWRVCRNVTPHYYQADAYPLIEQAWADGHKKVLCVCPTGSGKTVLCGEMIARRVERGERTLVMAQSRKIATQFRDSLMAAYGLHVGLEMGEHESSNEPVVCATFQTMLNRVASGEFNENDFSLVVIYECHRVLGDGYMRLSGHFKSADFIGLTATPRRTDKKDLMKFFDFQAVDVPLDRLIEETFLARLFVQNIPVKIELKASTKKGDYTPDDCAHAVEPYLEQITDSYAEHGKGKCGLVFAPLISTSKKFTAMLCARGIRAEHVDGDMKDDQVDNAIKRLELGEIDVLSNSMILSEGVDIRPVNILLSLRPTRSWTLYVQQMGRATRLFDPAKHGREGTLWGEKDGALILDPLWLCEQHSLLQRPSVLFSATQGEAKAMDAAIDEAKKQGDGGAVDLLDAHKTAQNNREEAIRKRLVALAGRKARFCDAMTLFKSMGLEAYEPVASWEKVKVTPSQKALLVKNTIDVKTVSCTGHAQKIIDHLERRHELGLCTVSQATFARACGVEDALTKSFVEVASWIRWKELCRERVSDPRLQAFLTFGESKLTYGLKSAPPEEAMKNLEAVNRETRRAVKRYVLEAKKGNTLASSALPASYKSYYRRLVLAPDEKSALAQFILGVCYAAGIGIERDLWQAVEWLRAAGDRGNTESLFRLGLLYLHGLEVKSINGTSAETIRENPAEAAKYLRRAAAKGHPRAQYELGNIMYRVGADNGALVGTGAPKNLSEAVDWLRKAADQNDSDAQLSLALIYANGQEELQNDAEALRLFSRASDNGHTDAQFYLRFIYGIGPCASITDDDCVKKLNGLVRKGHALAQYFLGNCYFSGKGVAEDKLEAVKWYKKATERGNINAKAALSLLKANMVSLGGDEAPSALNPTYSKNAQKLGGCHYCGALVKQHRLDNHINHKCPKSPLVIWRRSGK